MRPAFLTCTLLLLAGGCVVTPRRAVVESDLAGMFGASFDFHAEARIHLKTDHTFETYTVSWRYPRTTPRNVVPESSGHDSGRWALKDGTVVLVSANGVSSSLKIHIDRETLYLIRDQIRYRRLYAKEPNQLEEPALRQG